MGMPTATRFSRCGRRSEGAVQLELSGAVPSLERALITLSKWEQPVAELQ